MWSAGPDRSGGQLEDGVDGVGAEHGGRRGQLGRPPGAGAAETVYGPDQVGFVGGDGGDAGPAHGGDIVPAVAGF